MVFVLVMLLVRPMADIWSHVFFKSTEFPGGKPTDQFVVALRHLNTASAKDAYEPAFWKSFGVRPCLLPGKA